MKSCLFVVLTLLGVGETSCTNKRTLDSVLDTARTMFMAIGPAQASTADSFILYLSAPDLAQSVLICETEQVADCQSSAASAQKTTEVLAVGAHKIFRSPAFSLHAGLKLAAVALDSNGSQVGNLAVEITKSGPSPAAGPIDLGQEPHDYMEYAALSSTLQSWAQKAPSLLQFGKFGTVNGLDTVYVRASKAVSSGEKTLPKVLITAATHGNEWVSTTTVMGLLHRLASAYGKDPKVTDLLNTRDVYFIPVVCPDGYTQKSREVDGGIDPNRSYPGPDDPNRQMSHCAANMKSFFDTMQFNATIDYHAYGRLMMYPWSYTDAPVGDDMTQKYQTLACAMAKLSGYQCGQIPDLLYIAPGSSGDYFHWRGNATGAHTFAMAVEVADEFKPDPSAIEPEIDKNYQAIQLFIKEAPLAFVPGHTLSAGTGYGNQPLAPYKGLPLINQE